MDGHSSHMTANFIAFCMQTSIDLLILPPHCSHVLQPLDLSLFAPLKRALAEETDAICRLDSGRISRVEWIEMYIRAREKSFTSLNILSGWKGARLMPLSPISVLEKLSPILGASTTTPRIPSPPRGFDLSLLESSPPDGTELRKANAMFINTLKDSRDVPERARRYIERMTRAYEMTHNELATVRKQMAEQQKLLNTRKKRKRGERVAMKGKFVFTTEEVLEIAQVVEAETAVRSAIKRSRKGTMEENDSRDEDLLLESDSSKSELDCIILASRN